MLHAFFFQVVGSTWYELYEGISPRQTSFLLEKGELVFERPSEDTMRIDLKAKTLVFFLLRRSAHYAGHTRA